MEYKVSELASKAGVTKRTIHYYISKGLLQPPIGSGINSVYSDEHLERLILIKELQSKYLPLSKIREYIFENPKSQIAYNEETSNDNTISLDGNLFVRENICNIFEINCSQKNWNKYKYIIDNVKTYVEKMMEN